MSSVDIKRKLSSDSNSSKTIDKKSKHPVNTSVSNGVKRTLRLRKTNAKFETISKEVKLYPIFSSPSRKLQENESANKSNQYKANCKNKQMKESTLNDIKNNTLEDSSQNIKKASRNKRKSGVKVSNKRSRKRENDEFKDLKSTTDSGDELSVFENIEIEKNCDNHNKIEPVTEEIVESEIQKTVDYDNSLFKECVNISPIVNNLSPSNNHVTQKNNFLLTESENNSNETNLQTKIRKNKHNRSSLPVCTLETENTNDLSLKRKSLRSTRNKIINYSEIDSPEKCSVKRKLKTTVSIKSNEPSNVKITNSASILNSEDLLIDCSNDNSSEKSRNETKDKNVNENLKLFSIFTKESLLCPDESKVICLLGKRKALSDEVNVVDLKDIDSPPKKKSRRKRVKNDKDSMYSEVNSAITSDNVTFVTNLRENHKTSTTNSEIKNYQCKINDIETIELTTASFDDSDINILQESVILGSVCIKNTSDEFSQEIENTLGSTDLKVTVNKKAVQSLSNTLCFPLFSHLNSCDTSCSLSSKFNIYDDVSDEIIPSPAWNGVMGLIDFESMQMLKSNKDSELKKEQKQNDLISISSDVIVEENNVLWTDLQQTILLKEKNNEVTVKEIKSWLLQWKNKSCKNGTNGGDSSSENYSSGSDSDDDFIYNGIIISGIPGSGKTSLVFSIAKELGFTVLEVNASSCRNGRSISHQLKEALESYHMESIKVENSINNHTQVMKKGSKNMELNAEVNQSKINQTKDIKSFFQIGNKDLKTNVKSPKKASITNFFQANNAEQKQNSKLITRSKHAKKRNKSQVEIESKSTKINSEIAFKADKNACKISSLTIILFDDVDIVFEEDEGFWSTVKGFLRISKKPVIFTVGRNLSIVKSILNSGIRVFNMAPTSKDAAVEKLKNICEKYSRDTSVDLELLTSHNASDFRRNILNAQFWTRRPKGINELLINEKAEISCNPLHNSKLVHINSFITGDLSFSNNHIKILLFDSLPHNFENAIFQYQSLGYDILHSNFFYILNILQTGEYEKLWHTLTMMSQKQGSQSTKQFSDSQMWQEACELFERKKKALKSGSCSKELHLYADTFDDFSYADSLKGLFCNKFQWISSSQRVKMWTSGLPICSNLNSWMCDDVLHTISLILIYNLRKLQKETSLNYSVINDIQLVLEHPFLHFDQSFSYKTEEKLKCVAAAVPPSYHLNKTALTLDYLSTIKIMCQDEEYRQVSSGKRCGRFLHYFDSISFLIDKKDILNS